MYNWMTCHWWQWKFKWVEIFAFNHYSMTMYNWNLFMCLCIGNLHVVVVNEAFFSGVTLAGKFLFLENTPRK